ncbi:ABC transporter ATP-binding protein [Arthrobacter sp. A2-55]|uniref:ABC transporter ATP-binding protein n=1 Tax=Arthrobacter sp. A2-55 TaxID=2897337 RepID=UPI0021CD5614|nr:ABC transporter ATP-binding protein [Arthrobacter sp. A2-55]MCU6480082.1 ABC transporter ATP-binding protein/permease [Arthrobacter sp. A2-55]
MKALWGTFKTVLTILPESSRGFLRLYSILVAVLALFDAFAMGLLALVLSPMMTGSPWRVPVIGVEISGTGLFVVVGVVCGVIVLKGVFALVLQWWATRKLARIELELGDKLFDAYLAAPWVERLRRNSSDLVRIADVGIANTIAGFLLPALTITGEVLTFVVVVVVLAVAQPLTAAVAIIYLGLVALLLYFSVSRRSVVAGRVNRDYSFKVAQLLTEMVTALKEVTLRNKSGEVADVVHENRIHTSRARANIQFLGIVPRYVLEAALIGGFAVVGAVGYLAGGATQAEMSVALFALAGFRMAPSLQRFQSIISQTSSSAPFAEVVVKDIKSVEKFAGRHTTDRSGEKLPAGAASLDLNNVSFRYSPEGEDALKGVTLSIPFGSTVAFVGSSGAGKSTLVDLILGLVEPTAGVASIGGVPLEAMASDWRSRVGYVPQEVALFDATVAQNVALTWTNEFDRALVKSSLAKAQMLDVVESRDGGVDRRVGERGLSLSGGQRQRLGIARALYAEPVVLVMDEATSALDSATEAAISQSIQDLHGKVTVILVAHRLSTIRHADQIFFLANGQVQASGTFDELISAVPDFAEQASLAGLVN